MPKPALKRFHLKFNSLVCQYNRTHNTHTKQTHTHTHNTHTHTDTHTHHTCLHSNAIKPVQIVSIFACHPAIIHPFNNCEHDLGCNTFRLTRDCGEPHSTSARRHGRGDGFNFQPNPRPSSRCS